MTWLVFRLAAFALLAGLLGAVAFAQAPALNIKLGAWEISSAMNVGGQLPIDTSKMTPEQKARMEASMAGRGPRTRLSKTCMTKEKFEKGTFLADDDPEMTCKQTLTTNTRTTLDSTVACTGVRTETRQMHIDAPSPTAFKATLKTTDQRRQDDNGERSIDWQVAWRELHGCEVKCRNEPSRISLPVAMEPAVES